MIGYSEKRVDSIEKVTGKALYTEDIALRFPDAVSVKFVRSPFAHARILEVDTQDALKLPGVIGIYRRNDFNVDWNKFPMQAKMADTEAIWAGQAIALVVAETEEQAEDAANTVKVQYEQLPHILNWKEAIEDNPKSIIDIELKKRERHIFCSYKSPNISGEFHVRAGDTDNMWDNCDEIVQGEFSAAKKSHNQLEKPVALVQYYPELLIIYSNGCGVHRVIKNNLCDIFSLPRSTVRVVQPYTGGSFGNRNSPYVEVLAVLVSLKVKRSVFLKFSRSEMFFATPSNWNCGTRIKLGAKHDGTLIALDYEVFEEIGASVGNQQFTGMTSYSSICSTYKVQNVKADAYAVLTNTVPAGYYRGPGTPESVFGLEVLIDRLAKRLGMSGLDLRKKNLLTKGDKNFNGQVITSVSTAACLDAVAHSIAYGVKSDISSPNLKYGKGIACAAKQNSPIGRSEAVVLVHEDDSIEVRISCDQHGMGASTAIAQIASEEFKVPIESITVKVADTDVTPYDHYSASCRSIYNTGNAVVFACRDAVEKIKTEIGKIVGVHPSMVKIKNHVAHITGSNITSVPIKSLFQPQNRYVQDIYGVKAGTPIVGYGVFSAAPVVPPNQNGCSPRLWNWFQYAATGVEIAVNIETGQIKICRVANAADSGNPINPRIVETQLEGGTHMAIGFALNEEHIYNQNGQISNANLSDYRLPTILDMPLTKDVFVHICPDPLPDGPYGAKGMAESISAALAPAIGSALFDAVGVQIDSYPFTAEKVLSAIHELRM